MKNKIFMILGMFVIMSSAVMAVDNCEEYILPVEGRTAEITDRIVDVERYDLLDYIDACSIEYNDDIGRRTVVQIRKFPNYGQTIRYFPRYYSSEYFNKHVSDKMGPYLMIEKFDTEYIWTSEKFAISVLTLEGHEEPVLEKYLAEYPSDLKSDLDQTVISYKDKERAEIEEVKESFWKSVVSSRSMKALSRYNLFASLKDRICSKVGCR
ncbi:hypothetical protein GF336_05210 [Candidatus Woesearchaeota archaeon]|nr:hypothetical protein [Candidatus Woesearchaeota archaeon]